MNAKRDLHSIAKNDKILNDILERVAALQTLTAQLKAFLPEPLNAHCWAANLEDGALTIGVDNTVWMSHIRALTMDLLRHLRQDPRYASIRQIKGKVQLFDKPRVAKKSSPALHNISSENAETLQALAEDMDDPALKAVLERLAKRHADK